MADYRRAVVPGGTFFFTVVTCNRQPILGLPDARASLRAAIQSVRERLPWEVNGFVLLPDHLHCVWTLPRGDSDYATRWRQIKSLFTKAWIVRGGCEQPVSVAREIDGGRGVWQRRYYERVVRDEGELRHVLDYIHINPVKHGLCDRAVDWPWSSFHRYVCLGEYDEAWGGSQELFGDEWNACE